MKKGIAIVVFIQINIVAMCQKTSGPDINIYLGARKTGIGFGYSIASHTDIIFNISMTRYFSIGAEAQAKVYLFSNTEIEAKHFGTPFIAVGYEYINSAKFNKEDSRHFVTGYYIPDNRYVSGEIGYRFYGRSKKDASGHTIRNVDVSVSVLYNWGLQNGYAAYVRAGSDMDGQVNKINKFMTGGWGGAATIHIPLKLIIRN